MAISQQATNSIQQYDIDYMKRLMPDYLRMKGIDPTRKFRCISPSHSDHDPSMGYRDFFMGKPYYKIRCFSCGASYDIFDLVQLDYGLKDMREAALKIADIFHIQLDGQTIKTDNRPVPKVLPVTTETELRQYKEYDIFARIGQAHENAGKTDYFTSRGFSSRLINEYVLGYWEAGYNDFVRPIDEALTNKLSQQRHYTYIIPIMDENGVPRNFIARMNQNGTLDDINSKTLNMKGVEMRLLNERYLYNPDLMNGCKTLFIVEGWADALSIEQAGGRAIALNSTANVDRFLRLVSENADKLRGIVFVAGGDRDKAGTKMNAALIEGYPDKNVLGLNKMGIRNMPFNLAGYYKDANEYLTSKPAEFEGMIHALMENRLGKFRNIGKGKGLER